MESRTVLVAQHFLFQNRDTFIGMYMLYGDKADFLRQPFTPAWQQRFADLDLIIGDMADKLRAAGIPLVVIPAPSRAEAALLSSCSSFVRNVDPSAFGRQQLEMIALKHGAVYVDLMAAFRDIPNSGELVLRCGWPRYSRRPESDRTNPLAKTARWQCSSVRSLHAPAERSAEALTVDSASLQFLAFAFAAVLIFNLSRAVAWRQSVLLVASIGYLGFFFPSPRCICSAWQAFYCLDS